MFKILCFLLISNFVTTAWAAPSEDLLFRGREDVSEIEKATGSPAQDEVLDFLYDPAALGPAHEEAPSTARKILLARIPIEFQQQVQPLTDSQLEIFLNKKDRYLSGVKKFLLALHLSKKYSEKILSTLEQQFYPSALDLAKANSTGAYHHFYLNHGLGLQTEKVQGWKASLEAKADQALSGEPTTSRMVLLKNWYKAISLQGLADFIPRKGGYFYLFGGSTAVSRVEDLKTQKVFWTFDVFFHFHRLKSITSFISHVTFELLVMGVYSDQRQGDLNRLFPMSDLKTHYTTTNLGGLGQLRRGDGLTAYNIPVIIPLPVQPYITGGSFPPFVQMLAVFEDSGTRYRLFSLNLTKLNPANWYHALQALWQTPSEICRHALL